MREKRKQGNRFDHFITGSPPYTHQFFFRYAEGGRFAGSAQNDNTVGALAFVPL